MKCRGTNPDQRKVEQRIRSEESRINNHRTLSDVHQLFEHIFEEREESFHWNLLEVVEFQGIYRNENIVVDEDIVETELQLPDGDLQYNVNHFVAVNIEACTAAMSFWLGQVMELKDNADGVPSQLVVRWYEVYEKKGVWKGKYKPAFLSTRPNHNPWTSCIFVASVITELQ